MINQEKLVWAFAQLGFEETELEIKKKSKNKYYMSKNDIVMIKINNEALETWFTLNFKVKEVENIEDIFNRSKVSKKSHIANFSIRYLKYALEIFYQLYIYDEKGVDIEVSTDFPISLKSKDLEIIIAPRDRK